MYQVLINDAKDAHNKMLELLPVEEKEHEIWFKVKLLSVNEFFQNVAKYRTCVTDKMVENIDSLGDAEIKPTDSVSNVGSDSSVEHCNSSRSRESSIMTVKPKEPPASLAHQLWKGNIQWKWKNLRKYKLK